ncbi:hypothetical protein BWQ96_07024 [Gracilariopsis chorda]|uniref:Uncharacterized protein n=1 Tax=Gracilariopsis chorda TaxID=448386 RepID=A0A2V3IME8_9FLOR|nr:hypothetical protein BWQ96_07024 [Gracilariopsis chorda]|eukprot:PXF43251.1 hypothetical protein BWQ96_07024 [Gracilariopsis chorda]
MISSLHIFILSVLVLTCGIYGQETGLAINQGVTYEWCEVKGDTGLCRFAFKDLYGTFDHVKWGSGNFSLKGSHSGSFTPRIVWKSPEYFDSEIGRVKSVDRKRDVFTCEPEYFNNGSYYEHRCTYLNIPGRLFNAVRIRGTRGSGISRSREHALRRHVPNGACVLMYLTEYEILDTSVSPPRVREVVRMPARQARIENNCVLFYAQF